MLHLCYDGRNAARPETYSIRISDGRQRALLDDDTKPHPMCGGAHALVAHKLHAAISRLRVLGWDRDTTWTMVPLRVSSSQKLINTIQHIL